MKCSFISIVIQLLLVNLLIASSGYGQNLEKKVQLKIENASVKKSLLTIEANSGIHFLFRDDLLNSVLKNVTLKDDGITIREAINEVLKNTPLEFKVMQGFVTIVAKPLQQRITGKVIDGVTKETLPGVSVRIKNGQGGTTTDNDGNFSLTISSPEVTLVFSYMGYNTREVKMTKEKNGLAVALIPSSTVLSEVTVQARRNTRTENAVLDERKKSATVQDAISAQQIERTGSITTTQALQKVSGVTVTDDKYVAIRGLGDRSVVGQLNGVRLASSDPDRSSIPLDLVPASLLDNITIYKTVTPDKPADAAAGIVELKTKSVPDSMIISLIAQSGFNSNIGIGGQYNSFYNSDMGFFGNKINKKNLSSDFLNLSKQYKGGLTQIQNMITNSGYSPEVKQEVGRINGIMQGFDPVMTTKYKQAPINQLYSGTFGNSYTLFKKHKLGVIAGANYYRRTTDISNGDIQQYSIYQGVVTGNPQVQSPRNIPNYITPNSLFMGKYQTYKENTGAETLNYGTLLGLTYRFSPRHEISMQYLGSWGGETQATNMSGRYEYTGLPGEVKSTIYSLKQSYRKLNTFNLQGEHKFLETEYSPRLSYNVASSRAGQNDPDYRFLTLADYTPRGGAYYTKPVLGPINTTPEYVYTEHLYALSSGYVNGFGAYGIIQAEP
ncbi:STN domain-containing protein, partial [Pedobacter sp. HMWF019]|uniref:STN domain-containing protein n=1 Tax=Pedobacter sp. HMWF019 TaxID=2056856 RepID=UPI001E60CB35